MNDPVPIQPAAESADEHMRQPAENGGALGALRYREYRFLFSSDIAYYLAMIGQMALRSIITWDLTHSAVDLSAISLGMGLPMLLLAPLGGVAADRFERRRLIILGQLVIFINGLAILALLAAGSLQFWQLMVTTIITGCAFPIISPARQALVANIVPRHTLSNAFALSAAGLNLARVVGPAAVGLLYPWLGATMTWGGSVLVYGFGIVTLLGVSPCPVDREGTAGSSGLIAGLRYLGGNHALRVVFLLGFIPALIGMPFQALLIIFADQIWQTGTEGFGLLQAAAGLGAVTGSVFVARQSKTRSVTGTQFVSLSAFGLLLAAFAISSSFWFAMVLIWLAMACGHVFMTTNTVAVHLLCSDAMRGRMASVVFITIALTPLGTVPMAYLAEVFGAPVAVALAGGLVVTLCWLMFVCSANLRGLDRSLAGCRS